MLQFLKINNFLLFKNQEVLFDGDFTVITGETGAGKSMFIKALRFVLGEKQELPLLNFVVIAEFKIEKISYNLQKLLKDNDIEFENYHLIFRRSLTSDNKNKVFINDVPVTLKLLKNIAEELVEFHSQHKQLSSFNQANSLNLIDQFLTDITILQKVTSLANIVQKINTEIDLLISNKKELESDKDYIKNSLEEITHLRLQEGEELELLEKKRLFSDKAKLIEILQNILGIIVGDSNFSNKFIRAQKMLSKFEHELNINEYVENVIFHLNELHNQIEKKLHDLAIVESIDDIEERLSKIKELCRKYRCNSDQLNNISKDFESKLSILENIDHLLNLKNLEKEKIVQEYFQEAQALSHNRRYTAKILENKILNELKMLKLEQVEFKIDIISTPENISSRGIDIAKFLIKTNKGFDFTEIDKTASGGELSRIMLAFKVALAQNNQKVTIVFDEIDTGTGGAVAETIGKRMKELSQSAQIIAISHQPQVASKATQHLLIEKEHAVQSQAIIKDLSKNEKVNEIARMLSGINISENAVLTALNLIEN